MRRKVKENVWDRKKKTARTLELSLRGDLAITTIMLSGAYVISTI